VIALLNNMAAILERRLLFLDNMAAIIERRLFLLFLDNMAAILKLQLLYCLQRAIVVLK
jgi:hypothetical protein